MKHPNIAERESASTNVACEGRSAQPSCSAVQICPSRPFPSSITLIRLHEGSTELPIHEAPQHCGAREREHECRLRGALGAAELFGSSNLPVPTISIVNHPDKASRRQH